MPARREIAAPRLPGGKGLASGGAGPTLGPLACICMSTTVAGGGTGRAATPAGSVRTAPGLSRFGLVRAARRSSGGSSASTMPPAIWRIARPLPEFSITTARIAASTDCIVASALPVRFAPTFAAPCTGSSVAIRVESDWAFRSWICFAAMAPVDGMAEHSGAERSRNRNLPAVSPGGLSAWLVNAGESVGIVAQVPFDPHCPAF